ncbi:MAG TPA: ABC transporter substrate-binding protein [Stackebrandtia sp.]|jgi:branched-chain amino acid transport system substrate-binding protein|uniref:ABC transporter substrate-binding protein n=1 Tax=Stackebrandtia sp. TaxID=2023065 RepID=UPI002D312A9D|nr:ABC transporter substrate-binding protein [Stackebrandtia sp.]HZE39368.1 ABC transporter substrate-binding protein [Stackebrandtia sp.]
MRSPLWKLGAAAVAVGVMAVTMTGCAGSGASADTVNIGWEYPKSGTFQALGIDMENGFNLYLKTHHNKLGGRNVKLVPADETDKPDESLKQAQRLVEKENVQALAGIMNSAALVAIDPYAQENKIPIVSSGGRPDLKPKQLDGVWHTGSINEHGGEAAAPYIKKQVDGPVYAMGADYAGGWPKVKGFTKQFQKLGGKLANADGKPEWTSFPKAPDFQPYMNKIADSGAKAIFAFYSGTQAIDFIKAWASSDAADIPLYGPNLTEGSLLKAEGKSAKGIYTPANYSADLDNSANRDFVSKWTADNRPGLPDLYAATAWDAAQVLDKAIKAIPAGEEVTGEKINKQISKLGEISSPRGDWQFDSKTHAPIQPWYMRVVKMDGNKLSNVKIADLETL